MTTNENNLLEAVHELLNNYDPEFISPNDMEDFNDRLVMTLSQFDITLDRYHDMLLEEVENMVYSGE
jgi:hypothetical protein